MEQTPRSLKGGLMHKMYSLFTTKGKYAVKLLNPYVMKRETAKENYSVAEKLEIILEQHNLPIIPALIINERKMQQIDEQYFYLYEWYDGHSLIDEEITIDHCRKIGKVLASIHAIDKQVIPYKRHEIHIDWDYYINELSSHNKELYQLIVQNRILLYESQEKGNLAIKKIPPIMTICHNDMDSKNVLWNGNDFRIIDLECLVYSSPLIELYEMALCWSGYEKCNINYDFFKELIRSYYGTEGKPQIDIETIYYSNYGRLEWLEYNIKRALGIDCAIDEIDIGISEVYDTLSHVIYYNDAKDDIFNCLKQLSI